MQARGRATGQARGHEGASAGVWVHRAGMGAGRPARQQGASPGTCGCWRGAHLGQRRLGRLAAHADGGAAGGRRKVEAGNEWVRGRWVQGGRVGAGPSSSCAAAAAGMCAGRVGGNVVVAPQLTSRCPWTSARTGSCGEVKTGAREARVTHLRMGQRTPCSGGTAPTYAHSRDPSPGSPGNAFPPEHGVVHDRGGLGGGAEGRRGAAAQVRGDGGPAQQALGRAAGGCMEEEAGYW